MEPEPVEEKSVDEVLDQIDWEKLGVEGVQEKTKPPIHAETEAPLPAKAELRLPDKLELFHHGSDIEIVQKWFNGSYVAGGAFAIVVFGWLAFNSYSKRNCSLHDWEHP